MCVYGTGRVRDGAYSLPAICRRDIHEIVMLVMYFMDNGYDDVSDKCSVCASVQVGECVGEESGFIWNQVR